MINKEISEKVDGLVRKIVTDFDVVGILGFGSYFENNFKETSDVDLIIIWNRSESNKKLIKYQGLIFEIMFYSTERINEVLNKNSPSKITIIGGSKIVKDTNGFCKDLIEKCKNKMKKPHPSSENKTFVQNRCNHVYSYRKRIETLKENAGLFEIYTSLLLKDLVELYMFSCGQWCHRGIQKGLGDIALLDPEIAKAFENALAGNELMVREKSIDIIINEIFNKLNVGKIDSFEIDYNDII